MSIKLMSCVWKTSLSSTQKLVFLYYADRSSDNGKGIWPAKQTVANCCSLDRRTVFAVTKFLLKEGYLTKDGKSIHRTVNYRINIEKLMSSIDQQKDEPNSPSKVIVNPVDSEGKPPKPSLTINNNSNNSFTIQKNKSFSQVEKYIPKKDHEMQMAFLKHNNNRSQDE